MSEHILYKDGDKNIPTSIKDRNGEVVLDLCKVCGRGEAELAEPCVVKHTADGLRKDANELDASGIFPETASMLRAGADAMDALAKAEARVKELEQEKATEETGWLVEKHTGSHGILYYDGRGYTPTAADGLRFSRKRDAEIMRQREAGRQVPGVDLRVAEHCWSDATSSKARAALQVKP